MPEQIKILVVDDEPDLELLITMSFSEQIENGRYVFSFAEDGVKALESLESDQTVDVVLTDINMPRMDGLTLLGKINERYPLIRTVIISAYGDMSNIRTALNRGAFDFITKPIDLDDLENTLSKTVKEALERKAALENRARLEILKNELNVAAKIQTSILPRTFPPFPERSDVEVHAAMSPAKEVGGDFYDFFFIDNDHLAFVVGDVSGKGVPAALFMAVSRTFLKATALNGFSPGECLGKVNRSLYEESVAEMFVSMFYGILNTQTGEVRYSSAGHNPGYILSVNGTVTETERTSGLVIGATGKMQYEEKSFALQPGDALILYTDGVTEAMDAGRQEFGETRLASCVGGSTNQTAPEIVEATVASVHEFVSGAAQSDDMTLLVIKFSGR